MAQIWLVRFRTQMKPAVQTEHQRQQAERAKGRGRPKATVVTGYLIMDDSLYRKGKGHKMTGLGRHYSHTEGENVTGHCLFSGLYVLLEWRCPLQSRLYRQKVVCAQEGVPFISKTDLAFQEIE